MLTFSRLAAALLAVSYIAQAAPAGKRQSCQATNYLQNSGFESGASPWGLNTSALVYNFKYSSSSSSSPSSSSSASGSSSGGSSTSNSARDAPGTGSVVTSSGSVTPASGNYFYQLVLNDAYETSLQQTLSSPLPFGGNYTVSFNYYFIDISTNTNSDERLGDIYIQGYGQEHVGPVQVSGPGTCIWSTLEKGGSETGCQYASSVIADYGLSHVAGSSSHPSIKPVSKYLSAGPPSGRTATVMNTATLGSPHAITAHTPSTGWNTFSQQVTVPQNFAPSAILFSVMLYPGSSITLGIDNFSFSSVC